MSSSLSHESSFELQDPRQFTGFLHLEEETQFEDEMFRVFNNLPTDDWNSLFNNDEEQGNTMFMQEDRNDYRPKKSLTGVFVSDDDSDSDSITTTVRNHFYCYHLIVLCFQVPPHKAKLLFHMTVFT